MAKSNNVHGRTYKATTCQANESFNSIYVNIEGYDMVLVRMDRNRHGCARCLLLHY